MHAYVVYAYVNLGPLSLYFEGLDRHSSYVMVIYSAAACVPTNY